eukprot:1008434-Alexandrium_andersonii.AAC.1
MVKTTASPNIPDLSSVQCFVDVHPGVAASEHRGSQFSQPRTFGPTMGNSVFPKPPKRGGRA